jgi:hypothetical protein
VKNFIIDKDPLKTKNSLKMEVKGKF